MPDVALTSAADKAMAESITIPEAAVNAVLGYGVVFFGLILLMCVVFIMGKVMLSRKAAAAAPAPTPAKAVDAPVVPLTVKTGPAAPGTAGELRLYDTDPKTAAMVMAIVAEELKTPLNELRFKSIKEVK